MKSLHPFLALLVVATSVVPAVAAPKSSGFRVSNFNRNDVVSLWHSAYIPSEGYEKRIKWNGNYNGKAGKVSNEFTKDVERRVNYFRSMCGVPPVVALNTSSSVHVAGTDTYKPGGSTKKTTAAQEAALMMARNYDPNSGSNPAITHYPPTGLAGWSKAAWNGNANGNIAFGLFGPGAITEYMIEELLRGSVTSSWNSSVGHRRWILYPGATDFATGDQPGTGPERPPTNVLYITQRPAEMNASVATGFVAYPAPGFFPAPVNSRFWSLSHADADFSGATVSMSDASGRSVPIKAVRTSPTYGDPAIVWEVDGRAAVQSVSKDTRFTVMVKGIAGDGVPSSHEYSVVLINPDQLTSNQSFRGPRQVSAKSSAVLSCPVVPGAEARKVTTYVIRKANWKESAEKKRKTSVVDHTGSAYPLVARMSSFPGFGGVAGKKAFHLTFPTIYDLIERGIPDQIFELDRAILPKSRARLDFLYRRGFMTKASHLVVEISRDGGLTWKRAGKKISGTTNTTIDYSIDKASIPLPKSSKPIRVRFRYYVTGTSAVYVHDKKTPTGIFIDDIEARRCQWLEVSKTKGLPTGATSFKLSRATGGRGFRKKSKLMVGMSSRLGGHWFPDGPLKKIRVK